MEISQDQLLGEGDYADVQRQSPYDDHVLDLPFDVWDRTEEKGKKNVSFSKVIQGPKKAFMDFLQRLTLGANRKISNSEVRQIITESSNFEAVNSVCKRIIRLLKARSVPLKKYI